MEIEIIGGGYVSISDEQIKYWSNLYDGVDVEYEIEKMDCDKVFKNKSKIGAFKAINRNLEARYNNEMPYVCGNCNRHFDKPNVVNTSYEQYHGVASYFPNSTKLDLYVCPYCNSDDIEEKYY